MVESLNLCIWCRRTLHVFSLYMMCSYCIFLVCHIFTLSLCARSRVLPWGLDGQQQLNAVMALQSVMHWMTAAAPAAAWSSLPTSLQFRSHLT